MMRDFRSLKVWQKGHEFVLCLYKATAKFPKEERYGLTSQLRRAGLLIPSNIAEGSGIGSDLDFSRFLQVAIGAGSEVEYLLLLSRDLKYLRNTKYQQLLNDVTEIKKMLTALIRKIRSNG